MNRLLFIFILTISLFAASVSESVAITTTQNFINSRSEIYSINNVQTYEEDSNVFVYIFKLNPRGFVLISGDDVAMPVLGFSFENNFSDDMPIQVDYLLNVYKSNIEDAIENNTSPSQEINDQWHLYSHPFNYIEDRNVSPLLTCNWNQDSPWNDMCPEDFEGPGGNVYAGCVAISMAQVMYYWGYPEWGYGSHGYNPGGGYGYQSADFGNTFYDYENMEDYFATEASQLLIYHAGVAVNMGYSPNGSGASVMGGSNSTYSAMKNYFIYDHSIYRIYADDTPTNQYREYLQSDLDENQPIIYVGYSDEGGHAWNLDGYDGDYFHSNFGWGGSNNGYYLLSAMNGFDWGQGALINIVPEVLDDPHIVLMGTEYYEVEGDGDQEINPGETVAFYTTIENFIPWDDANEVSLVLESMSDDLSISTETVYVGDLASGDEYSNSVPFEISIAQDAQLGIHQMMLHIFANDSEYSEQFEVELTVSLFQAGFPYDTFDQIKTSPLVVDIDGDNDNDIIFSDNMGFVHLIESDGTATNINFPYEIGNDVWGSISAEDIDLDGDIEFVVTSSSKNIYIFDKNGIENIYYSDDYLLGTPAIGQIDSDPYYEIVVGGFGSGQASSSKLYAINHDATDVESFPIIVGEKIKSGVALADFNENGLDDIVFGTDTDNIHLIYDDASSALGFPVLLGDKIQSEPSIAHVNDENIIFVGSKDDSFYSIDSNGEFIFSFSTDGNIYTSPSFLDTQNGMMIFIGSDDGHIYCFNLDGEIVESWYVGGGAIGSIVFADLDSNGIIEIIASVNSEIIILNMNGEFTYPSILHDLQLASAPTVMDINDDGNLEIVVGTGTDLSSIDFKFESNMIAQWYTHRCNERRTGYFISTATPSLGDINFDSVLDILDVVILINFVLGNTVPTSLEYTSSDINGDSQIDVIDIVLLVNLIIE